MFFIQTQKRHAMSVVKALAQYGGTCIVSSNKRGGVSSNIGKAVTLKCVFKQTPPVPGLGGIKRICEREIKKEGKDVNASVKVTYPNTKELIYRV